jgi:phage baseplate assembly protein W
MDYGTDFKLVDDDIVFTPDGDVEIVSGPACVAQDIDQTLKTAPGRLVWDKEAGSTMMLMLNDSGSDANAVIAELERVAGDDPRVDLISVSAKRRDEKKYRLEFQPVDAITPEVLEYDLSKGDIGNG